jgi:hypothetical protein
MISSFEDKSNFTKGYAWNIYMTFTVTFNDPNKTYAKYYAEIESNIIAAGLSWNRYIHGSGGLDIKVDFTLTDTSIATGGSSFVFYDNGSIALWQMDGAAITSSTQTSTPSLDSSWTVAGIGDYNGDGKADITWRNTSGAVNIWQMNGAVVTSSLLTSLAADNSWKIAAPII